jgi:hypothetical protein
VSRMSPDTPIISAFEQVHASDDSLGRGKPGCASPHKEGCLAEESCPQGNRRPALSAWLAGRKIVALLSLNWFMIPPMLRAVSYRLSSPGPRSIVLNRTTSRPLAVRRRRFMDANRFPNVVCDLLGALRALTRRRPTEPSDLSPNRFVTYACIPARWDASVKPVYEHAPPGIRD